MASVVGTLEESFTDFLDSTIAASDIGLVSGLIWPAKEQTALNLSHLSIGPAICDLFMS